jgi:hypothetical protein
MLQQKGTSPAALTLFLLLVTGVLSSQAFAQRPGMPIVPKPVDKLAMGEDEVKQLVILIGGDKEGKVSREEFLNFMDAEFARLDKDESGKLDVRPLAQSNSAVIQSGKGSK